MSPLSDTTNMSALAAKANLYDHIKQMFVTTVPAMTIACIAFTVMGLQFKSSTIDSEIYTNMLRDLSANFRFSPFLVLPPVLVIGGAILKKPTVPVLILSSAVAMALGLTVQGFGHDIVFAAAKSGFSAAAAFPGKELSGEILTLLNRGGASSMFEGVIYVIIAFTFGGIIQLTNCLEIAPQACDEAFKDHHVRGERGRFFSGSHCGHCTEFLYLILPGGGYIREEI